MSTQSIYKRLFLLISTLAFGLIGCSHSRKISSSSNFDTPHISDRIPKAVIYDTLSGTFFYEDNIQSYILLDAITAGNGFIHADSIDEAAYKRGYIQGIIASGNIINILANKGVKIRSDTASIARFYNSSLSDLVTGKNNIIEPFCGAQYVKYNMKIEVAYIDTISRKLPLFVDCETYKKLVENKHKNYQLASVPTYVITKVFSWQEH